MSGRELPAVYTKPSPISDEKKTHEHRISNLPSYKSSDVCEPSSRHHTCCGSYITEQLCKQIQRLIDQHSKILQTQTMAGGDQSQNPAANSASPISRAAYPVMPRPGQPGALRFDGKNISEFLDDWNLECEDYDYSDEQKCTRFPNYCESMIKDVVKLLPGYVSRDWTALQTDLKGLYWQHDKPKNTTAAVHQLIHDAQAGRIDLNVYVLQYTTITTSLVAQGALSTLDRVNRLLDGLSDEHRKKVLSFCTKNNWKLSAQDVGTVEPNYDELKPFVLREAQTSQMQAVYDKEHVMREGKPVANSSTIQSTSTGESNSAPSAIPLPSATSIPVSSVSTPADSSHINPVAELMTQLTQLSLSLQAAIQKFLPVASGNRGPVTSGTPQSPIRTSMA